MAAVRSKIGGEYLGGTTPVEGGKSLGGAVLVLHSPPAPGEDFSVGLDDYGGCRMFVLDALVRYEGSVPVWRLVDVVALPPMSVTEFASPICTTSAGLAENQRPVDALMVAVADGTDPTPGSYQAKVAWRIVPYTRFESVSAADIRCPKGE